MNHLFDVLDGLLQVARDVDRHYGGPAVGGHQRLIAGQVVVQPAGDDVLAQGYQVAGYCRHLLLKGRVVHRQRFRLNHHYLGYAARAAQPALHQTSGPLRFYAAGQPQLGGGGAAQQLGGNQQGDDAENQPYPEGKQRPSGAGVGQ